MKRAVPARPDARTGSLSPASFLKPMKLIFSALLIASIVASSIAADELVNADEVPVDCQSLPPEANKMSPSDWTVFMRKKILNVSRIRILRLITNAFGDRKLIGLVAAAVALAVPEMTTDEEATPSAVRPVSLAACASRSSRSSLSAAATSPLNSSF